MAFFKKYIDFAEGEFNATLEHNGFIYAIGLYGDRNETYEGILHKLDLEGNVVFAKTYRFQNTDTQFRRMILSSTGDLLINGTTGDHTESFVCKISASNGNVLWNRNFPNSILQGYLNLSTLYRLNANEFLFACDYDVEGVVLYKMDEAGNILLSKSVSGGYFKGIFVNPSETKIIIFTQYISVLDTSLNLIFTRGIIGTSHLSQLVFLNDNEVVISSGGAHNKTTLVKFNINELDSLETINTKVIEHAQSFQTPSLTLDSNNNVLVSTEGYGENTHFSSIIIKMDQDLNVIWSKRMNIDLTSETITPRAWLYLDQVVNTAGTDEFLMRIRNSPACCLLVDDQMNSCLTENFAVNVENIVQDVRIFTQTFDPITIPPTTRTVSIVPYTENPVAICGSNDPVLDIDESSITANPTSILADGSSESEITVQLNDATGNPLTTGGPYNIQVITSAGTLTVDSGLADSNGRFTTTLVASTSVETALLQFTVNGDGPSTNTATVEFTQVGNTIEITNDTSIQSPHLYLQSAGSDGSESTEGRHLRWAFRGALGEKHLPKGNYAGSNVNFNKPNDFVKIYRAPYVKKTVSLNFFSDAPEVIDHSNYLWIYRIDGYDFYVRFENNAQYDQVLLTIDPSSNPTQFLGAYGKELIEIENLTELFFMATCNFQPVIGEPDEPYFKVETLSVETNDITANKTVSNRRLLEGSELNVPLELTCENGRSIRGEIYNIGLGSIDFEFYTEIINEVNETTGWDEMGAYALSLDSPTALAQLEPTPGDVHGKWQRFNDNAFVNIPNYEKKWEGTSEPGDRNIKEVVEKYMTLSDNASNPTAIEEVPLGNDPSDPNDYVTISNLDVLNLAASDYHIARLLGLGILDVQESLTLTFQSKKGKETKEVSPSSNYIYVAEYFTVADLEDGQGIRDVHHLYMSLPTTNSDHRLPVPVNLDELAAGLFIGGSNGEGSPITDEGGYTYDGLARYITLYSEEVPDNDTNTPFFVTSNKLDLSTITTPIFGGLEYKINDENWQKPELSNDPEYNNEVPVGDEPHFETRFLMIPEPQSPYFIHRQTVTGLHTYKAYGINWFSRAVTSDIEMAIETVLKPANPLKPPSATNALLIRNEAPLLLTSEEEQDRLGAITDTDKTLIRLSYNYHSTQDLKDYRIQADSTVSNEDLINLVEDASILYPDSAEIFAEKIETFFRNEIPNNVTGKALSVTDDPVEEALSIIPTGIYEIASDGSELIPYIAPGTEENFIGGVFVSGENKYVIHAVSQATEGPVFTVYKKEISDSILAGGMPSDTTNGELEPPILTPDGLFMAIENMQSPDSWGNPNPLGLKVTVGDNWPIHREVIEYVTDDGEVERHVEKSRGIWNDAHITKVLESDGLFGGMYKIEFDNYVLHQHSQYVENGVSAEWFRGSVRVLTQGASSGSVPSDTRKVLSVLKIENIKYPTDTEENDLIIYAQDPGFNPDDPLYDAIPFDETVEVNFYPGYKVYLYKDTPFGLDEPSILPAEGEDIRYSIFSFRSHDPDGGCDPVTMDCFSKVSVPNVMYAQEIIEPMQPRLPQGPLYATRPDFFGRSTYTITTEYQHKPHGVLFYRSNDEALLNALYEKATVLEIRRELKELGGNNEEWVTDRWQNFIDFPTLEGGDYDEFPPTGGYKFPNPDKQAFFDWANGVLANLGHDPIDGAPGTIAVGDERIFNFVKGAIYSAFVPLTEMPILYKYLNGKDYKVLDQKQVVRDHNGAVIAPFDPKAIPPPEDTGFRMAPMAKVIGITPEDSANETLFTDFKLDGTSNNLYFYGVKELGTQLKMSEFSPFLGPIKLVNTNAAETPEIKRAIPVLENDTLGIEPKIQLEVNAFPEVQNIKKLTVYRTNSLAAAQSVQSMQVAKVIDLADAGLLGEAIWTVQDGFDDLLEIPYGDGLYYRVTALREVEYAEADGTIVTEYAPSQASKIVASAIVEVKAPESPKLQFLSTTPVDSEIHSVSLKWTKTAYNAKYYVYKMNEQGNWVEIHVFQSNDDEIELALLDTALGEPSLKLLDSEGLPRFHHFKVIAQNTAGMLSKEENILTIFNEEDWIMVP
ncbi:MAG: Ig-like domain-containing protein [Bacteroidota bacterium]